MTKVILFLLVANLLIVFETHSSRLFRRSDMVGEQKIQEVNSCETCTNIVFEIKCGGDYVLGQCYDCALFCHCKDDDGGGGGSITYTTTVANTYPPGAEETTTTTTTADNTYTNTYPSPENFTPTTTVDNTYTNTYPSPENFTPTTTVDNTYTNTYPSPENFTPTTTADNSVPGNVPTILPPSSPNPGVGVY